MTFAQIPSNSGVFIDANILIYYFTPDPVLGPVCQQVMDRIAQQEFFAYASTHVVHDVAHRLMTMEAMTLFGWPQAGIARRLRQNPSEVQKLTRHRQVLDEIPRLGIEVLQVSPDLLKVAGALCQQHGFLMGDGLILAVMQDEAITRLASHDADFDRVPGITRYAPV